MSAARTGSGALEGHDHDLGKRTWPEARELFAGALVALQPIGATEPHGPHLRRNRRSSMCRSRRASPHRDRNRCAPTRQQCW